MPPTPVPGHPQNGGTSGPELSAGLKLVARVAQDLNVAVYVLAPEGDRAHVIHVHRVRGEVA